MKRNLGIPGMSPDLPGIPGTPRHAARTPQRRPWDAPETPETSRALPGPEKRPYLNKFIGPEAFDCCIRILPLQRIIPMTPLDHFIMYSGRTDPLVDL